MFTSDRAPCLHITAPIRFSRCKHKKENMRYCDVSTQRVAVAGLSGSGRTAVNQLALGDGSDTPNSFSMPGSQTGDRYLKKNSITNQKSGKPQLIKTLCIHLVMIFL